MSDSKRFEGEVKKWSTTYGFISYTASGLRKRIYFSSRTVCPDWRGSRAWVFSFNVPITFTITQRNDSKSGLLTDCAVDVSPIFSMSEPQDLNEYRETSTVVQKGFGFVFLQRPCGDTIFLHKNDVVPQYQCRWNLLVKGAPVFHAVGYDKGRSQWQANAAELYSAEELDEFFHPRPVEPEPMLVEAKPQPELELETVLAPATRSLPLIEIIRRRKS